MNASDFKLPLACEGSVVSYFLSMCNHESDILLRHLANLQANKQNRKVRAPIFVIGCPRSGTSILGKCLSSHTRISGGHESLFLLEMSRIFYGLHQGVNRRAWRPLNDFTNEADLLNNIREFSENIFSMTLENDDCRYLDHTPWYVGLMMFINSIYDDSVFVHIIRDGRDVVNSLSKAYDEGFPWAGRNIAERASLWQSLVKLGTECGKSFEPNRYLEIRYEDLCSQPIQSLRKLADGLQLEWEDNLLLPLAVPTANPSRSDATIAFYDNNDDFKISPKIVGNVWPKEWSQKDRSSFSEVAISTLVGLGYYPGS